MGWMIAKIIKPLCILADANIIIALHEICIWDQFANQCQIVTTAFIQQNEAKYFKSRLGTNKIQIDLTKYIQDKLVSLLTADHLDLVAVYSTFDSQFLERLDPGEIEAIALIIANKNIGSLFCTADGPAIQALAMLGKSSAGISLQKALEKTGFTGSVSKLRHDYRENYYRKHKDIGSENLITGFGLKKKPY